MQQQIQIWLTEIGLTRYTHLLAILSVIAAMIVLSLIIHLLLHKLVMPMFQRQAQRGIHQWPRALLKHRLFQRATWLIQGILFQVLIQALFNANTPIYNVLMLVIQLWMMFFTLLIAFSLLDVIQSLTSKNVLAQQLPLRGMFQSCKLLTAILMVILMISLLLGKSPGTILTGLGAMTAVLILVFRDPILGLVAGVQLAANDMLKINDWLDMPKYGADGAVIDINLTTVKVQNWDNTIVTIPAYALISDSFKNWRGMSESGGRRIKRSFYIDCTSVHFLTKHEFEELSKARLLSPYLQQKDQDIQQWNRENASDNECLLNNRALTNLGTFRMWIENWLRSHPNIRQDMLLLVRQLAPSEHGIPLEIYAFANRVTWAEFERIQNDIFEYIYAAIPSFGLRMYQTPSGNDLRSLRLSYLGTNVQPNPSSVTNSHSETNT